MYCNATWTARGAPERDTIMTKRNALAAIGDLFITFGSAVAVSRAVEAGRKPRAQHLADLGIDPRVFDKIRYY
ncbi:MAG: hypothetical protein BGO03_13465 [Mesorhizobium sp. 61-13]|nr:MAG: hypothetical protein BGO03_13465 [Mesorhizobium sp. 61-13]